jgi:putative hydrolase of the HAD superfamily
VARGGLEGPVDAVLFDVDFTLAKPGPLLGPEGYRNAGERHGLTLEPDRYAAARAAAVEDLEHHPELEHDEEIWVRFTEDIVRGMGGEGPRIREVAEAITAGWLHSANFELYDDVLPVLAHLRETGVAIGLVSNTSRDLTAFVHHFSLDVDAWISSGVHGKVKPSPTIFLAALELLGVEAHAAVMVGDSPLDDVEGARALGMRAYLIDREGRFPEREDALPTLLALPALLGLRDRPSGRA